MKRLARKMFSTYISHQVFVLLPNFKHTSSYGVPKRPASRLPPARAHWSLPLTKTEHRRSRCALILLQCFWVHLPLPPHFQYLQELLKQEALDKNGRFLSLSSNRIRMSEHYVQESSFLLNTLVVLNRWLRLVSEPSGMRNGTLCL